MKLTLVSGETLSIHLGDPQNRPVLQVVQYHASLFNLPRVGVGRMESDDAELQALVRTEGGMESSRACVAISLLNSASDIRPMNCLDVHVLCITLSVSH